MQGLRLAVRSRYWKVSLAERKLTLAFAGIDFVAFAGVELVEPGGRLEDQLRRLAGGQPQLLHRRGGIELEVLPVAPP